MKKQTVNLSAALILILAVLIITPDTIKAQNHKKGNNPQKEMPEKKKERIEAQHIAFITQRLNLTPAEAKVFWPVYDEFDAKRKVIRKSLLGVDGPNRPDIDNLTEKEAEQLLDNQLVEAQKLLDLRKEYHNKFKSVLPAVKVLKLYDAERDFQKMLLDRLRHQETKGNDKK
jgi:hypothetical protein